MRAFVGREKEIQQLETMYQTESFQMAVIYGRRRVGKTTLINQFMKGKKGLYFMAAESSMEENLHSLSRELWKLMGQGEEMPDFTGFGAILQQLAVLAQEERIVVAVDEYPYLAGADPSVSSVLQRYIDHEFKNSRLFLVLCGSSMSFMEHQVLGYKSPLYGRRTAQIKVNPFSVWDVRKYFEAYSDEEIFYAYACTSGIPEYLQAFDESRSIDENIKALFFSTFGRLYEEPSNLLKQELRSPASYNAVISAIAGGYNKLSEIASRTGQQTSGCCALLTSLMELGIVEKITPCGETSTKKTLYRITDQMFRFWYRFVSPNLSLINAGYGDTVYEQKVKPLLNDFCGPVFKKFCEEWLLRQNGQMKLPELFSQISTWWGGNPKTMKQEEIDILLRVAETVILCECKWRNEQADRDVLDTLLRRGELFSYPEKYYYMFSKSGFTASLSDEVRNRTDCVMVEYCDMLNA